MCIRNVAIVSYLVNFCFVLPHMDVIQLVGYVTAGLLGCMWTGGGLSHAIYRGE